MNDVQNTTIFCHNRFVRKRLAGEKFRESPKECFTNKADDDKYCRGAGYGETCSNNGDADCDVDLYCSDRKVCEHAAQEAEHCAYNIPCASHLLCAWEDGIAFKCRPYGFHTDGEDIGPGEEDDICHSRYRNAHYKCEQGPKLTHSNLRDYPGEKCIYTHGDNGQANCWYQHEGKAICRRGVAELRAEWLLVLSYLAKKPKCHVAIPMGQCDMGRKAVATDEEWSKIWFAISKLHWENQMEGILDCMKSFIHPEAFKYEPRKSAGSFLTLSVLSLLPLLLLLL